MQRGNYRSWKDIVKSRLKVLTDRHKWIFAAQTVGATLVNPNNNDDNMYIIRPQWRNMLVCCWCRYSRSRLVNIETYAFVEYGAAVLSVWITGGRPRGCACSSKRASVSSRLSSQRGSHSPPTKGDRQRWYHSLATLMPFSRRCVCSDNQCQSAWRSCALR